MMTYYSRRQVSVRVLALCLGSAVGLLVPTAALGADAGSGGTVRATIDGNGAVTSAKQVASNGATSAFAGQLPIKMSITHTAAGSTQTYTYHVENTFSQTQTVHFTDTAGRERHTSVSLQLPLVAQLGVDVPGSMSNLTATGASVTTGANSVRHLLWNMVLFTPLGSSTQDVSFTASGKGSPVAELRATSVDPSTTAGLSAKSQDKTAEFQQEDFWAGYASGGNDGLKQLGTGVGQIVDGLNKLLAGAATLHSGLASGLSGTQQAATGSTELADGAKSLTSGLALIHGGLSTDPTTGLTGGLALIHSGLSYNPKTGLTGGLKLIHAGLKGVKGVPESGLVPALTAIHGGLAGDGTAVNPGLTAGLAQISDGLTGGTTTTPVGLADGIAAIDAGLQQLDGPDGLVQAIDGLQLMQPGVQSMIGGLGSDANPLTLIGGASALASGLQQVINGLTDPTSGAIAGLSCAADIINRAVTGATAAVVAADPCFVAFGLTGPISAPADLATATALTVAANVVNGVVTAMQTTALPALNQMHAGAMTIRAGLSTGDPNNPGILEGAQLLSAGISGLLDPNKGLPFALAGVHQMRLGADAAAPGAAALRDGAALAYAGSIALRDGSAGALGGAKQLQAGSANAIAGSKLLYAGSGKALAGSRKLLAGSGSALSGSTKIRDGLAQLSDGLVAGAKSFPAAVDGAGQIADGLGQVVPGEQQVKDGISAVLSGATGPLESQLTQASANAHQQIAVLTAAASLATQAPGGAGTSYVLAQPGAVALAGSSTSTGSSHTGRNALLISLGGIVALAIGLGAGLAAGRQRVSA